MMNRLTRIGLAALLTTALAGSGAAWAQDKNRDKDDEEDAASEDDDSDPCADVKDPCGGDDSEARGAEAGGGSDDEDDGKGKGRDRGEDRRAKRGDAEAGGMSAEDDMGTEAGVAMGPTLPEGRISIAAWLQVSLADGSSGDPLSIAPDIWYGINPKLSAGVVTSIQGQSGFWSGLAGTGICVSGDNCSKRFDNVGAEALYALKADSSLAFAADAGFHALSIDLSFFSAKLGIKGVSRSGKLAIGFAPSLLVAVTNRGDDGGNLDRINLPVDVNYMMSSSLHVGLQSGITDTLEHLGDNYSIPIALGATYLITPKMSLAGALSLDSVLDANDATGATDLRSLSLSLGYMM